MTNTDMSLSSKSSLFLQQLREIESSFDQHIPLVYQQLLEVLKRYFIGIPISSLPWLETVLGVKDIKKLVDEMVNKGLVFYFNGQESKEECVMSARMVEVRQKVFLKNEVEDLLNRHGGEIAFESFEDLYKHQFNSYIEYDYYALTDLDHLCQVLKDILVVEVANPSGAKVIKAVEIANPSGAKVIKAVAVANPSGAKVIKEAAAVKIYNLRKRKRNE